jgi:hypothetical protein
LHLAKGAEHCHKSKSFLVLFFKKELLPSLLLRTPAAGQARVKSTLASVTAKRPVQAFSATDLFWQVYYRTLIGVGLDACWPGVIKSMPGFLWR